ATESIVDLCRGREELPTRRDERELVQLRDVGDARSPTEPRELRGSRVAGVDLDVRRPARALEARQRGLGPAGTGEQCERHRPGEADQQRQHHDAAPTAAQLGATEHQHGTHHSLLRTAAGRVFAARSAGNMAITFTARSAAGTRSSTPSTGHVGSVATPSSSATASHTTRPVTRPSGIPTTRPTAATVLACHAIVARTWRRAKPSVLRTASSRRRRRTAITSAKPTASSATSPTKTASATGNPSI